MKSSTIDPDYKIIGRVLRPHGIRGELRVEPLTDQHQYFSFETLLVGKSTQTLNTFQVDGVRFHQGKVLLKLTGIDDRNEVELMRSFLVCISSADIVPLAEGEFYLNELVGMSVITDEGERLGEIVDTIQTGANDVFVVQGPRGEILIPDIEDVVLHVDGEEQRVTVHLIEGLLA